MRADLPPAGRGGLRATLPEVLESWPDWTADERPRRPALVPQTQWVLTKRDHRIDGPARPLSGGLAWSMTSCWPTGSSG